MPETPVIVADADIPFLDPVLGPVGRVIPVPGHRIGPQDLRHADALVVRSVTRVDEALLGESRVKFVGSATSGVDHVDLAWLQSRGIAFSDARGANAESVVEYVLSSISAGLAVRPARLSDLVVGIVGCGRIGERLAGRAESLGMTVLRNDPPLVRSGGAQPRTSFVGLGELLDRSDVVSIHVPLETRGIDATRHLIDRAAIDRMKKGAWLIQSSRGGTVDETAAVRARRDDRLGFLVLDVWEGEPLSRPESMAAADIATPHIAGYSRDAKLAGVLRIRDALADSMGLARPDEAPVPGELPGADAFTLSMSAGPDRATLFSAVVPRMYDVREDDARFRAALTGSDRPELSIDALADRFHALRASYPARWAFSRYTATGVRSDAERRFLTDGIGIGAAV